MNDPVVTAESLRKAFGREIVGLDDLDLTIRGGETYGLLGPNGAGKSTLMYLLAGLTRPDAGRLTVFGGNPRSQKVLGRVGWLGDGAFYPFLSGYANLLSAARRSGVSQRRVEELLDRVGLLPRAGDVVRGYSLGMRQRLGLAVALLKDPELLILDEPSNGLDPVGQLEVRDLIRSVAQEGRTVILSSHDVEEVETLCTRVGVMAGGRLIMEGTPAELRGAPELYIRASPQELALQVVSRWPGVVEVGTEDATIRVRLTGNPRDFSTPLLSSLVEAGLEISGFELRQRPLRAVFLEATNRRTGGQDSRRPRGR